MKEGERRKETKNGLLGCFRSRPLCDFSLQIMLGPLLGVFANSWHLLSQSHQTAPLDVTMLVPQFL